MRFFRNLAISYAAALARSTDARMEEPKKQTLQEFADAFGKKLDAQDAVEAAGTRKEGARPAGTASAEEEAERATGAVDEELAAQEETGAARAGAPSTDADDPDDEAGAEGDEHEETDRENEHEEEDEDFDEEFETAAARAKLPLSLEDIPEEARPLVKKRLKEVEAGFTRAMQDARKYRAEERFRREHPVDFIAEMLAADPDLEEKVSAELEKRGDETYAESRKIITDDRRKKAAEAIDTEQTSEQRRELRIGEVESLAADACKQFGIPFGTAVEAAIANAIITSESGDVDNREIKTIVKNIAKEMGAVIRKEKVEEGRERVLGKIRDRSEAPTIRPGSGRGAAPTPGKGPKLTLEQKMARSAEKMFPGAD